MNVATQVVDEAEHTRSPRTAGGNDRLLTKTKNPAPAFAVFLLKKKRRAAEKRAANYALQIKFEKKLSRMDAQLWETHDCSSLHEFPVKK